VGERRWWLAPCSLNCGTCPIHLRTDEELAYWREKEVDLEKIRCDGCRSDRKGHHWAPDCKILQCCVYERGFEFCSQCPDLPCEILEEWAAEYEHHAGAVKTLVEMKKEGIEKWLRRHGYC